MSRRGKKKAKPVPLSAFIGTDESPQTAPQSHYRGRRDGEVVLPQGPRASRAVDVDLSRLPTDPPFHILISNLSYDSEENSLRAHLGFIKEMGDVTWNYKEGRRDGTAFVEFNSRDGAVAALGQTDTIFGGRKIVINVAEMNADGTLNREPPWRKRDSGSRWEHDMYPQRGTWRENRGRSRYSGDDASEPGDDWRSREQSYGNRDGFHSNREHSRDSYYSNREHSRDSFHGNREHSRDSFHSNRERRDSSDQDSWRSHDRDSSSFSSGQRYRGRGGSSSPAGDQSPEGGRWSYSQGREDRRGRGRRPWRGRGDGSYPHSYDRENSNDSDTWRRSGPDRTDRPEERESPPPTPPRGEEREPSSAGPSIFGGAKPVDTSAREREMEEKMSRLMTPGESPDDRGQRGDKGYNREDRGYNREDKGYNREDRGYNREDKGYNREDKGYNREDRGYNREDKGYNREDRGYNREDKGYNREDRGYNREDKGYNREDRGYNREDRGYNREDKGYNREDRGYNREDRGYNREDKGYNREDRGYNREDRGSYREDRGSYREDRGSNRDRDEFRRSRGDRRERREFRGERREYRDRRGQYRSEGAGEGDRGSRRPPEGKSAPKGVYKEQEQPEFAKNTRFSLLESD